MRLRKLVWKELFERKSQVITGLLAILLGITVIVAIKNITFYSEKAVAQELDALGANILILPKSATLQNYYSADMQGEEFPQEYVERLTQSNLQGVDNLSPKLSVPVEVEGSRVHSHRNIAKKRVSGQGYVARGRDIFQASGVRNSGKFAWIDPYPAQGDISADKGH